MFAVCHCSSVVVNGKEGTSEQRALAQGFVVCKLKTAFASCAGVSLMRKDEECDFCS